MLTDLTVVLDEESDRGSTFTVTTRGVRVKDSLHRKLRHLVLLFVAPHSPFLPQRVETASVT